VGLPVQWRKCRRVEVFYTGTFCIWAVLYLGYFETWDVMYLGCFVVGTSFSALGHFVAGTLSSRDIY
jgi:hypothetical protein